MKNEGLSEKRKWEMLGEKIIFKVVFKGGGRRELSKCTIYTPVSYTCWLQNKANM